MVPASRWIALELELHLLAQLEIKGAERLVEEQGGWAVDERACEGDALLLTARELAGAALRLVGQTDDAQHLRDSPANLVTRDVLHLEPIGDVGGDCHMGEEAVGLEDHVHVALRRADAAHVHAVEQDPPPVGSSKPAIMRSTVVLPQPLGPSREKNSPAGIWSDTWSTARSRPKTFVTRSRAIDPGLPSGELF